MFTDHCCSGLQDCQAKAWRAYHKYECAMLKENQDVVSLEQALCRLLLWRKKNALSKDDFRFLTALETHYETRMDRNREQRNGDFDIDQALAVATNAQIATKSTLDLSIIQRLYYAVSSVQMHPRRPMQ